MWTIWRSDSGIEQVIDCWAFLVQSYYVAEGERECNVSVAQFFQYPHQVSISYNGSQWVALLLPQHTIQCGQEGPHILGLAKRKEGYRLLTLLGPAVGHNGWPCFHLNTPFNGDGRVFRFGLNQVALNLRAYYFSWLHPPAVCALFSCSLLFIVICPYICFKWFWFHQVFSACLGGWCREDSIAVLRCCICMCESCTPAPVRWVLVNYMMSCQSQLEPELI